MRTMRAGLIGGGVILGLAGVLGVLGRWADPIAQADEPAVANEIEALVAQLDHPQYRTREEAHAKLVALGMAAFEPLRAAERTATSLEVKTRLAAILREIASVHWRENDLAGALAHAKSEQKPVLVFSTIGGVKGYA